jgi:LysM repeat protein
MPFAADVAALATPPHAVVAPSRQTVWTTVTVRAGDTLWDLAIRHHTSVAALVAKNRLAAGGSVIHIGQKLLVPGTTAAAKPPASSAPGARAATKPATKPATTPATTARKPTTSTAKRTPPATTALRVHVVRAGDTMWGIAQRYKVSLSALLSANHLSASSYIYVGQRITLPGAPAQQSSSPAPAAKPAPKPAAKPTASSSPKPTPSPAPQPTPAQTAAALARARAVAASKAKLAAMTVPTRTETADLIRATATRHGVDPKLALAIGWLESGWYQRAVSPTNAVGVMQVMPDTGRWASQLAGRTLDLYDVRDNITAGVLVLRALQTLADSEDQALAAYYQGLYSVRTKGLYTDTKAYVANVKAIAARL